MTGRRSPRFEARDSDAAPDRRSSEASRRRDAPVAVYVCDLCGAEMLDLHCKLVCERCGYKRDCSDP